MTHLNTDTSPKVLFRMQHLSSILSPLVHIQMQSTELFLLKFFPFSEQVFGFNRNHFFFFSCLLSIFFNSKIYVWSLGNHLCVLQEAKNSPIR